MIIGIYFFYLLLFICVYYGTGNSKSISAIFLLFSEVDENTVARFMAFKEFVSYLLCKSRQVLTHFTKEKSFEAFCKMFNPNDFIF